MAKFKFTSGRQKKKINFLNLGETLDGAKTLSGVKIEMLSNREVTVDGCRGISEYNDFYIKLRVIGGSVIINGKKLEIPVFERPLITVRGIVSSIEFCIR
ncbi:MAG: YabP/YqfC family sporulation protein [Clostridia bacterium]|nr:YabP/YqfC family sporulation protein [Clostridia bacterium]